MKSGHGLTGCDVIKQAGAVIYFCTRIKPSFSYFTQVSEAINTSLSESYASNKGAVRFVCTFLAISHVTQLHCSEAWEFPDMFYNKLSGEKRTNLQATSHSIQHTANSSKEKTHLRPLPSTIPRMSPWWSLNAVLTSTLFHGLGSFQTSGLNKPV
jgi:hypothetical protein